MEPGDVKAKLRREVLSSRGLLPVEERRLRGLDIFTNVLALPEYETARTILAYCGFGGEAETAMFLEAVLGNGKTLVLPRVERESRSLILHEVSDPGSQLTPGMWGIMEPEEKLPEVVVTEVDFILIPGVAFDREGARLGYGGGFYDRMLGGLSPRPALVAAAFGVQVVGRVPVEAHDVRVDVLVTEDGVMRFGG